MKPRTSPKCVIPVFIDMVDKILEITGKELFVTGRDKNRIGVLYHPSQRKGAPILIDVHGGGFFSGHHYSDDRLCSLFNQRLAINVASIEYRYAPEAVCPTATYDCFDALLELCEDQHLDFDRQKVFLMGHSVGGNIVAGMSLLADGKIALRGQILDYPLLDVFMNPRKRKYLLYSIPAIFIKRWTNGYFPDKSRRSEPLASPVLMTVKQAKKMPPTLVVTCGYDSLRQDGLRYVKLLEEAGANVRHVEYKNAVHGFTESVPNNTMKDSWWLPKKLLRTQETMFAEAFEEVCAFIAKTSGALQ